MYIVIDGAFGQDGIIIRKYLLERINNLTLILLDHKDKKRILHEREHRIFTSIDTLEFFTHILLKFKPSIYINLAAIHASIATMQAEVAKFSYEDNSLRSIKIIESIISSSPNTYFVHASSSLIYPLEGKQYVTINSPPEPASDYGIAKYEVMKHLDKQRAAGNVKGSSLVLFNHDSLYRNPKFLIPKILKHASKSLNNPCHEPFNLQNVGVIRDWSSAFDVCESIVNECMLKTNNNHLVGSGNYCSIKDILDSIFGTLNMNWRDYITYDNDFREDCNICFNPQHIILHDPSKRFKQFPMFVKDLTLSFINQTSYI